MFSLCLWQVSVFVQLKHFQIKQEWGLFQKYLHFSSFYGRNFYTEIFNNYLLGPRWHCFIYLIARINISLKKRRFIPCNEKWFLTGSWYVIALKETFKTKYHKKYKTEFTYGLKDTNNNNLHLLILYYLAGFILGFSIY